MSLWNKRFDHQFKFNSKVNRVSDAQIVRIGYLLQNFKCAIIQNREPDAPGGKVMDDPDVDDGRPCRVEIRWYGATYTGLRYVRDNVNLWGLNCEIKRHKELSDENENKNKSPVEIIEMVLNERWDLRMRKELYQRVHK